MTALGSLPSYATSSFSSLLLLDVHTEGNIGSFAMKMVGSSFTLDL